MSKQAYPLLPLTLVAGASLSANRFVTSAGAVPGAGTAAIGVNRVAASSTDKITVDVIGTAIVETGGVISAYDEIQTDASGRAVTSDGGVVLGIAMQASTGSGKFIEVLLYTHVDNGTKFNNVLVSNDITEVSDNGALPTSGISLIAAGTGLPALTLAAPSAGCQARIRIISRTSGDTIVTTASGVTFDGTNNTATLNAVGDELVLGYKSATQWIVIENTSVTLSSV